VKEAGSLDSIVKQFNDEIVPKIKKELSPRLVVIFGSRVRGDSSKESDIDILIVSDFFEGKPFLGRMPMMLRTFKFAWPVDYLCYSPEEFEEIRSSSVIIREALNQGIEVVSPAISR
jgi:predicted nucleotidyltransferase